MRLVWIVREKHAQGFSEAYVVRNEIPTRGYYGPKGWKNRPKWFFWRTKDISNKTRLSRGMIEALGIQPGECFLLVQESNIDSSFFRENEEEEDEEY